MATVINLKATITQNVVKATVLGSGTQGSQGPQGPGSNVRVYTWVIDTPAVGGIPGPRIKEGHTITSIESYVTAPTSVTFNVEKRTVIGSAGVNLLSPDQVADTDGTIETAFANNTLEVNNYLWLDISGVLGTPGKLVVTVSGTV